MRRITYLKKSYSCILIFISRFSLQPGMVEAAYAAFLPPRSLTHDAVDNSFFPLIVIGADAYIKWKWISLLWDEY